MRECKTQVVLASMVHAVMQEALIEIVPAAAAEALGSSHGGVFIGKSSLRPLPFLVHVFLDSLPFAFPSLHVEEKDST